MSDEIKKAVRWYRKMQTWTMIFAILTAIAGGEAFSYFAKIELPAFVHYIVGTCGALLVILKLIIKDVNNDGIVD